MHLLHFLFLFLIKLVSKPTMNRIAIALLLSLVASIQGFMTAPGVQRPLPRVELMSKDDTDAVLTQASDCAEGECSLDEVADLISVLQTHRKELSDRVEEIKKITSALEKVSSRGAEVDEIRETVRALFRVFQLGDKASGNDYPSLSKPTGWSGEIGDGPKTAYDALPPKPYKK